MSVKRSNAVLVSESAAKHTPRCGQDTLLQSLLDCSAPGVLFKLHSCVQVVPEEKAGSHFMPLHAMFQQVSNWLL